MNQTSVSNFNQPQSQVVICSCPQNHEHRMTHPQRAQNADAKPRKKEPNHQMIESMAVELASCIPVREENVQSIQIVQNGMDACCGIP